MKLTPEELKLVNEWEEARSAYVEAKAVIAALPTLEERSAARKAPEYQAIKRRMSEMRTFWRRVGEAVPEGTPGHRSPVRPISVKAGL